MVGFLKGLFGDKEPVEAVKERRMEQRRKEHNDRREQIRWEPDKTDRRSGKDRRKMDGTWRGDEK